MGERERKRGGERQIETHFSQEYLNPQVWINKMVIGQSLPPKSFRVTHKNHCGPPRVLSQEFCLLNFISSPAENGRNFKYLVEQATCMLKL